MRGAVAVARRGFGLVFALLGVVVGVVFIAMVVGGGIYRTECIMGNGTHTVGWDAEGAVPYLWSPGDPRCRAHTLTRVLLGKAGVMSDVAR
jgi:hypothetical protein